MEEKEKILNEEKYKKAKKTLITAAIIVAVIGISIAGNVMITGINKTKESTKAYEAEKAKEPERLASLESKISKLKIQKNDLEQKQSKEFKEANGFSDLYYEYKSQLNDVSENLRGVEAEKRKIEMGMDTAGTPSRIKGEEMSYKFQSFFILFTTLIFVAPLLFIAYRRNVMAFGVQQAMPVVKEGMEEIAPTMGKVAGSMAKEMAPVIKDVAKEIAPAYGEVAKEIAKGIKEGMKDEDKQE